MTRLMVEFWSISLGAVDYGIVRKNFYGRIIEAGGKF